MYSTSFAAPVLYLALLGALVVWLVYAIKFGLDVEEDSVLGPAQKQESRACLAFQAIVATGILLLLTR